MTIPYFGPSPTNRHLSLSRCLLLLAILSPLAMLAAVASPAAANSSRHVAAASFSTSARTSAWPLATFTAQRPLVKPRLPVPDALRQKSTSSPTNSSDGPFPSKLAFAFDIVSTDAIARVEIFSLTFTPGRRAQARPKYPSAGQASHQASSRRQPMEDQDPVCAADQRRWLPRRRAAKDLEQELGH